MLFCPSTCLSRKVNPITIFHMSSTRTFYIDMLTEAKKALIMIRCTLITQLTPTATREFTVQNIIGFIMYIIGSTQSDVLLVTMLLALYVHTISLSANRLDWFKSDGGWLGEFVNALVLYVNHPEYVIYVVFPKGDGKWRRIVMKPRSVWAGNN